MGRDTLDKKTADEEYTDAINTAKKVTFTPELEEKHPVVKIVEKHPAARFVVPFVRTPPNLTGFTKSWFSGLLSGPLTHIINLLCNVWNWMRRKK
jgi:hypothetical protein